MAGTANLKIIVASEDPAITRDSLPSLDPADYAAKPGTWLDFNGISVYA